MVYRESFDEYTSAAAEDTLRKPRSTTVDDATSIGSLQQKKNKGG